MTEITKEGLEKLEKELEYLKTMKRKEITERLRKAIAFGDLSENFDYHNAREEQEFLEKRIAELQEIIVGSRIVSASQNNGIISLGRTALLKCDGEEFSFLLCDPQLASPLEGKISVDSPLGKALLGKKKGESVQVQIPSGKATYKILEIS